MVGRGKQVEKGVVTKKRKSNQLLRPNEHDAPADRTLTLSLDIIQLLKHARDIDDQPAPNKRHTLRVDQP